MKTHTLDILIHASVTMQAEHEDDIRRALEAHLECSTVIVPGISAPFEMTVDPESIRFTETADPKPEYAYSDDGRTATLLNADRAPQDGKVVGWLVRKNDGMYSDFPGIHGLPVGKYLLKAVLPEKQAEPHPETQQLIVWMDHRHRVVEVHAVAAGNMTWADLVKSARERAPVDARFWHVLPLNKL